MGYVFTPFPGLLRQSVYTSCGGLRAAGPSCVDELGKQYSLYCCRHITACDVTLPRPVYESSVWTPKDAYETSRYRTITCQWVPGRIVVVSVVTLDTLFQ